MYANDIIWRRRNYLSGVFSAEFGSFHHSGKISSLPIEQKAGRCFGAQQIKGKNENNCGQIRRKKAQE